MRQGKAKAGNSTNARGDTAGQHAWISSREWEPLPVYASGKGRVKFRINVTVTIDIRSPQPGRDLCLHPDRLLLQFWWRMTPWFQKQPNTCQPAHCWTPVEMQTQKRKFFFHAQEKLEIITFCTTRKLHCRCLLPPRTKSILTSLEGSWEQHIIAVIVNCHRECVQYQITMQHWQCDLPLPLSFVTSISFNPWAQDCDLAF